MKKKNFDRAKNIIEVLTACIIIAIVLFIPYKICYKIYEDNHTENKVYIELMSEVKTKRCEKGYGDTKYCLYSNYECIERERFNNPAKIDFSCKNLTTNKYISFSEYV